jgi:hypothetical protein
VISQPKEDRAAQEAYRVLLRDHVGPAFRSQSYKGSAGRHQKEVGDYFVTVAFQESKWSDRDHVDYRLKLRVTNAVIIEKFEVANAAARELDRERQDAPMGNWLAAFPGPMLPLLGRFFKPETFFAMRSCDPRDSWITLRATDDLALHAEALLDDINRCVLPELDAQLQAKREEPDRPEQRPLCSEETYGQKRRLYYQATLDRLRAAGIPTEPRDTGIHISLG